MSDLMPWHKTWLLNPNYTRVDLVKEGANSQAHILLAKSKGGSPMELDQIIAGLKPDHAAVVKKALTDKDAAIQEAVAKAATDVTEAIEKTRKEMEAPAPGATEEEIIKTIKDPALKALMEMNIAKTRAAEAVAANLLEKESTTEAIAKAKDVAGIGSDEEVLAKVYKSLKSSDPALCEEVFAIFKAAKELITDGGVFQEIGKANSTATSGGGSEDAAWAKIDGAAAEIAKSRGINRAAAITAVMSEQPDLYNAYVNAQRG